MRIGTPLTVRLIFAVSVPALLSACMAGMTRDADRLDAIEDRVDQVERMVDSDLLINMASQVEEIYDELRRLRGEMESLDHEVGGARERQREIYLDVDRRLRQLEVGGPLAGAVESGPRLQAEPRREGRAQTQRDARGAYEEAFGLLREGRYEQAGEAFGDFLQRYGDSDLAANAQYWLGEVHYVSRDFEQAKVEFGKVIADYSGSGKVADAKLKLGFAHYELGQFGDARQVLEDLRRNHSDSSAARLASNRLERMADEGR
jgi:tol-pal system protein YbgF